MNNHAAQPFIAALVTALRRQQDTTRVLGRISDHMDPTIAVSCPALGHGTFTCDQLFFFARLYLCPAIPIGKTSLLLLGCR
jgi:predicted fused transcriptional regulator/phosphomethylpyrimidine kinase